MLTKRDKAILADLRRFRVMDRDSIAEMHFAGLKHPVNAANAVLLRLVRDGYVKRTTKTQPYCYFDAESTVKPNSAKLAHWLAILDVYKDVRKHGVVEQFTVEPKYGVKGTVEPDAFMVFRKTAFFIEVQNSVYSAKQMKRKFDRYVDLFDSEVIDGKFPHVLMISEQRYALEGYPFRVFQAPSFTEFMRSLKGGIKVRIG